MSILTSIQNFIRTEVLGIEENDTHVKSGKKKPVSEAVIKCKNLDENVDTVEFTNKRVDKKIVNNVENNVSAKQKKMNLENKCKTYGVDYVLIVKGFSLVTGLTKEQFDKLSPEKQMRVYEAFEFAVDHAIKLKQKYGFSKDANSAAIINQNAKNVYEAIENGEISNAEELYEESGDICAELGKDFGNTNVKARRQKLENVAQRRKARFEARLAKRLKNVPEEQRADVIARMRARYNRAQRMSFEDVLTTQNSESSLHALVLLSAEDMGYGATTLMKTRSSQAEATRVASEVVDYAFQEGLIETFGKRGEETTTAAVREFNYAFTSNMTQSALNRYQDDYNAAREAYERGEGSPYMKGDYYTATAKGIGEGAYNNKVMSMSEKAEFLAKWEQDAKKYDDYELVTKAVQEEIAKNPEFAQKFEEAKVKLLKLQEKNTDKSSRTQEKTEVQPEKNTKTGFSCLNSVSRNSSLEVKQLAEEKGRGIQNESTKDAPSSVNEVKKRKEITQVIKQTSLDNAFKEYSSEEVVKTVLHNKNLSYLHPQIKSLIKSYDVEHLLHITDGCTTSAFLFVLRNISPEKAAGLYEAKTDLCFSARKVSEQELEKDKAVA